MGELAAVADPRAAELLRRRSLRNGTPAPAHPDAPDHQEDGPRKLDDEGKAEIRRVAAENPNWSASDLADAFEAAHGWRPSYQGIGRSLSEPAPRARTPRKPVERRSTREAVDPAAEVEAIAAVSRALATLTADEVRRVLDWARARFQAGEGGPT